MGLEFRICFACAERHAVQSTGRMSIHKTAAGERCNAVAPADPWLIAARAKAIRIDEEQRAEGDEHPLYFGTVPGGRDSMSKRREAQTTAEVDAAVRQKTANAEGAERERRKDPLFGMQRSDDKLDRKIYAVKGSYPVPGGLPTLGKRR